MVRKSGLSSEFGHDNIIVMRLRYITDLELSSLDAERETIKQLITFTSWQGQLGHSCSTEATRSIRLVANRTLVLVQRRHVSDLLAEDILADVVSKCLDLVRGMRVRRDAEHLVEFLERERFRLGDE